jgi:hypothetical protein
MTAERPSRGVIYMVWGDRAIADADESICSLWTVAPGLPVLVVGDEAARGHYQGHGGVQFVQVDIDPFDRSQPIGFQFRAGRVKPLLYRLSPFDQSLYVDADSDFRVSPDRAFDLLERWDFVVAETETRTVGSSIAHSRESAWTAEWLGTPHLLYHNSGMLFWRRGEAVERLFDLWSEEWLRFQGWDEQVALLRALLRSDALYLTVPHTWNCREGARTTLLHHRFGTKTARTSPSNPRRVQGNNRLIHVQIAPGRTVCCLPEEADYYRQMFAAAATQTRRR